MSSKKDATRLNTEITARRVRLVGAEGEQVGVVSINEALQLAYDANMDLV
ncbi:MAG: translation initiation factor IF-3, partial [Methylomonas sp.]